MKFKNLIESRSASKDEYLEAVRGFYSKTKLLPGFEVEQLIQMMEMSEQAAGVPPAHVEIGDSGNVFVRWAENDDSVWLLGIVSPKGHLGRADISDLEEWVDRLSDKMMEGKPLHTSPNEVSGLLLKRLERKLNLMGFDMEVEDPGMKMEIGDSPYLKWKTATYHAVRRES